MVINDIKYKLQVPFWMPTSWYTWSVPKKLVFEIYPTYRTFFGCSWSKNSPPSRTTLRHAHRHKHKQKHAWKGSSDRHYAISSVGSGFHNYVFLFVLLIWHWKLLSLFFVRCWSVCGCKWWPVLFVELGDQQLTFKSAVQNSGSPKDHRTYLPNSWSIVY